MVSIEVELEVKRGNATTVIECGDVVHPEDDEDKDDDEENEDESSLRQRLRAKGSSLLNLAKPRLRRAWDSTKRFSSNGFRRTREQYNQWRRQRAERQGNEGAGNSTGQPSSPTNQSSLAP
jgi:hypothetical protein